MKDKPKDIQYVLPYGESIRGFANQQFIPKTEVTKLLRERGIFVFNNDKSYTVPILQRLLLSPREFDLLRDAYNSREDNFKTISREIVWTDSVTLSELNNLPIDLDNFIRTQLPTCKLLSPIRFSMVEDNPNHIAADFKISRQDINKSWYEQTNIFQGSIEFTNENGSGRVIIKHTAPETKKIAEEVQKIKVAQFKENNIMLPSSKPKEILFSEFSNKERFNFFYDLTITMKNNDIFTCKDIIDISIKPDDSIEILPKGIDWMQQMKKLLISGNGLGQTFFMKDTTYHESLILWNVVALFEYDYHGVKGTVTANFGFSDYTDKGRTSEFEISVLALTNDNKTDVKRKKKLMSVLQSELDKHKSIIYNYFVKNK